ncbi:unnamed protein product [Lepidochelys olivacea]
MLIACLLLCVATSCSHKRAVCSPPPVLLALVLAHPVKANRQGAGTSSTFTGPDRDVDGCLALAACRFGASTATGPAGWVGFAARMAQRLFFFFSNESSMPDDLVNFLKSQLLNSVAPRIQLAL